MCVISCASTRHLNKIVKKKKNGSLYDDIANKGPLIRGNQTLCTFSYFHLLIPSFAFMSVNKRSFTALIGCHLALNASLLKWNNDQCFYSLYRLSVNHLLRFQPISAVRLLSPAQTLLTCRMNNTHTQDRKH